VLRSGIGRIDELKFIPVNVLLISAFNASKGVSSLDHVKRRSGKDGRGAHKSSTVFFNTDTEGKEELRVVKAF
jgi:hypothetical protein